MNKSHISYAFLALFLFINSADLCAAASPIIVTYKEPGKRTVNYHVPAETVERIQSDSQTFKDMMQDMPGDDDATKDEVIKNILLKVPYEELDELIKYLMTNRLPNGLVYLPSLLRAANYLGMMEITNNVLPKLTTRLFAKAVMEYFETEPGFKRYTTTDYLAKIDRQIIRQMLKQESFPGRLLARLEAWPNFRNEMKIIHLQIANYLILNQRLVGTPALAHLQAAIDESPILKALYETLAAENVRVADRQRMIEQEREAYRQRQLEIARQMRQRQIEVQQQMRQQREFQQREAAERRQREQEAEQREEAAKRQRLEAEQAQQNEVNPAEIVVEAWPTGENVLGGFNINFDYDFSGL